jgi:hypothetical protein
MPRSSKAWPGRPGGSRSSALVARPVLRGADRGALNAVPDPTRRLGEGVLVEACLRAHVLGLRLLTIRATVVLAPAAVGPSSSDDDARPQGRLRRPAGGALADARRSLDEGAELLAGARSGGR